MPMTRCRVAQLKSHAQSTFADHRMLVDPQEMLSLLALAERALEPQGQATMICASCGADRFKEDCKGSRQNCSLRGEAQCSQSKKGFTLPALPEPRYLGGDEDYGDTVYGYTADDMRAYASQLALPAGAQDAGAQMHANRPESRAGSEDKAVFSLPVVPEADATRNAALEEAAKIPDRQDEIYPGAKAVAAGIAGAIRALKSYPSPAVAQPVADELSAAARDVLAERRRQQEIEGWTPEHDDKYISCDLAAAAATYALCTKPHQLKFCGVDAWPWPIHWWKPTTYRRNLEKAGALIIAEIERIDRAALGQPAEEGGKS